MENNSALNGATTKDQAWKTKKGYGPMVAIATLLLGLAFYAGQMSGSTVAGNTRGAAASASMMSFQAFDAMMSGKDWCANSPEAYKPLCYCANRVCGTIIGQCFEETDCNAGIVNCVFPCFHTGGPELETCVKKCASTATPTGKKVAQCMESSGCVPS